MSEMTAGPGPIRPRRLRFSPALRSLVREIRLRVDDLIYPLFVTDGQDVRAEVPSMPGVFRFSVDALEAQAQAILQSGIPAVILFGVPEKKDAFAGESYAPEGVIQRAVRAIKAAAPELIVITDVCLCEYHDHGHCGTVNTGGVERPRLHLPEGYVLNDETLPILARVALSHAVAGADIVAPSGMLDGMVAAVRAGLDAGGFEHTPILSYAIKYASAFYGPFRDAAGSAPGFGDRRSHQMDPANAREALREAALDAAEGADLLMVKPALPYLDVIRQTSQQLPELPLIAYQVSGEYSMLKAAAARGWLDERGAVLETLTAIRRAGADRIISYYALEAAAWLKE